MEIIQVVSGVIKKAEHYFVTLRPPHVPFPGTWEFPGGKIEPGESPFEALIRELNEEIGIHVTEAKPLLEFQHAYPTRTINMISWKIIAYTGEPYGAEGQQFDWVTKEKLKTLTFPEANYKLIPHL